MNEYLHLIEVAIYGLLGFTLGWIVVDWHRAE